MMICSDSLFFWLLPFCIKMSAPHDTHKLQQDLSRLKFALGDEAVAKMLTSAYVVIGLGDGAIKRG